MLVSMAFFEKLAEVIREEDFAVHRVRPPAQLRKRAIGLPIKNEAQHSIIRVRDRRAEGGREGLVSLTHKQTCAHARILMHIGHHIRCDLESVSFIHRRISLC